MTSGKYWPRGCRHRAQKLLTLCFPSSHTVPASGQTTAAERIPAATSSPWEPPWYRSPARGPDSSHHNSPGNDRVSELASWRTIERLTSRMGDGFLVGTRCPLPPETDGDKCPKIREGREISSLIFNQKCKFILIFNVFVSSPGPGSHPSMVLLCCAPSHHPKPL